MQDRIRYLRECRHLELRTGVWFLMKVEDYEKMKEEHEAATKAPWRDIMPPFYPATMPGHVEIHVDQLEDTRWRDRARASCRWDGKVAKDKLIVNDKGEVSSVCEYAHDPAVCRCHMPIIHVGQDESIYKAYALPKGVWIIRGIR